MGVQGAVLSLVNQEVTHLMLRVLPKQGDRDDELVGGARGQERAEDG